MNDAKLAAEGDLLRDLLARSRAAGGGADDARARKMAEDLSDRLGVAVRVEDGEVQFADLVFHNDGNSTYPDYRVCRVREGREACAPFYDLADFHDAVALVERKLQPTRYDRLREELACGAPGVIGAALIDIAESLRAMRYRMS